MGQAKGKTGNPNGRPKGSPNKLNASTKSLLHSIVNGSLRRIRRKMKDMDIMDEAKITLKLMEFTHPKLQSTSVKFNFEEMTDQQLDHVIESLKQNAIESNSQ